MQISELEPLDLRVVPAQLHQGAGPRSTSSRPTGSSSSAPAPGRPRRPAGRARSSRKRGVAMVDPRSNILFVQDTACAAGGGAQDHPPDRHADPAGADRGAHRDRQRQVQPAARRALRRADRASRSTTSYAVGSGRQPQHAAGRSRTDGDRLHPRDADADAVRARVGHRVRRATPIRRSSTSTCRCPTPAGQLALTLINLGSGNLINLELSALEADNRGKVMSSPRVVTGDNQKAHIEQGTEIPYVTPGSANNRRRRCSSRRRCCAST